jgi:hypothetical protein
MYYFNNKDMIKASLNIKNINKIIREYLNLFFNKNLIKNLKNIRSIKKFKGESFYKLYVSKVEIKHTNNKSIITIYVYDKDKQLILSYIKKKLYIISQILKKIFIMYIIIKKECKDLYILKFIKKIIKLYIYKNLKTELNIIRRYKFINTLNKYKFEENFLSKLGKYFSILFNKKIEFNIIKFSKLKYSPDM